MKTYRTAEVAKMIEIHPNTVRLYEEWGFITKPQRLPNGYRVFTDIHIAQLRLARTALRGEVLQNGLRKEAVEIIKTTANQDYSAARLLTKRYLSHIRREKIRAEAALEIASNLLNGGQEAIEVHGLTRRQTADYLQVTIDTLRNWELNGLITVKRKANGYRVYTGEDLRRLTIIRALRCANYSLMSILRLINAVSAKPDVSIRRVIDTPSAQEDIVTACDKLLTSLAQLEQDTLQIKQQLTKLLSLSKP